MPKTLLLADDSVTIQKVVGISFANEDIELVTVDNGDDAVTRAREMRPDIVLADVVMPGKNGYEVCEAIKQDPELASTPVLLLTGTFETFDEDRAEQVGADGHITKPFEAQALVDQVNGRLAAAMSPGEGAEPEGLGLTGLVTAADASNQSYDLFEDEVTAPSGVQAQPESPPTTVLMDAGEAPDATQDDAAWADEVSAEPAGAAAELPPASETSEPLAHSEPLFDEDSAPDQTQAFLLDENLGGQTELGDVDPTAGDTAPPVGDGLFSDDEPRGATRLLDPADPADAMAQTRIDLGPATEASPADEMPSHARNYDVSSSDLGDSFAGGAQAPSWAEPMAGPEAGPDVSAEPSVTEEGQVTDAIPVAESDAAAPFETEADAPAWAVTEAEPAADAMTEAESSISNSETDPGFAPEPAAELVPEATLGDSAPETAAPWPAPPAEESTPSPAETVAIFPDAEPASDRISITEGMSALDQLEADAAPAVVAADPEPEAPAALLEPELAPEAPSALLEPAPELEAPSAVAEPEPEPMPVSEPVLEPAAEAVTEGAPAALSPMLERQLHDSIEKLAWDAFGDLSERLVKDAVERIEAVAWEVIPKMAETLIREEIRKLKDEE